MPLRPVQIHPSPSQQVNKLCPRPKQTQIAYTARPIFYVQGETKKYSRMHGAWCVGLITGDNYVAVASQRVAQGGIDNFDVCVQLVVGDAVLGVLNKGVIFAANKRIKQTSLEILHLLMQNWPCSDKVMQSLEVFFRFSNLRTPKSTLFGWTITLASTRAATKEVPASP
jgi:hypothetical protein